MSSARYSERSCLIGRSHDARNEPLLSHVIPGSRSTEFRTNPIIVTISLWQCPEYNNVRGRILSGASRCTLPWMVPVVQGARLARAAKHHVQTAT